MLTGVQAAKRCPNSWSIVDSTARQSTSAWISTDKRVCNVCCSNGNQLLRRVNRFSISKSLADGNVLEQRNQRHHNQSGAKIRNHVGKSLFGFENFARRLVDDSCDWEWREFDGWKSLRDVADYFEHVMAILVEVCSQGTASDDNWRKMLRWK